MGFTQRQVSLRTGVPVPTVRNWVRGRLSQTAREELGGVRLCPACGAPEHDPRKLPTRDYAYLLGIYLGDGQLVHQRGRSYSLRVALDVAYPGIIDEVKRTIASVRSRCPWSTRDSRTACVRIVSYWKQWPCLFPQHGPGRKHKRPIRLASWQQAIVTAAPEPFLRALIQTDGWRGTNRVHVKGRDYAYPRYQFSNRSADIGQLFTDTWDLIGVEWRPWGRWHISVAKRDSVARLDEFIGPKE
jgi:hypothetical protein